MNSTKLLKRVTFLLAIACISSCKKDDEEIPVDGSLISCNEITAPTTWVDRSEGIDYLLNCELVVSSQLTIAPGVVIQCREGASITIEDGGSLSAIGTATNPIILQGEAPITGFWKGLHFRSNSVLNELTYCTISHGGSESFDGNASLKANVRVKADGRLKLDHCTLNASGKDGLLIDGADTDSQNPIAVYSACTFTNNNGYPITCTAPFIKLLDGAPTVFTANSQPYINIRGGRMLGSHTWKKCSLPYRIEQIASVGYYDELGDLTVEPGVTIFFAGDAGLCTGEYSTGSWMKLIGTATERITLTGISSVPGAWKGIAFQSTSSQNQLAYTDISYGGASSYTGNTAQKGNIVAGAWSPGSFTIANCSISNSAAYGVYANLPSPEISFPPTVSFSGNSSGNYYHE